MTTRELRDTLYCMHCRTWKVASTREAMSAKLVWICPECRAKEKTDG